MTTFLVSSFTATTLKSEAATTPTSIAVPKPAESAEATALMARLEEIKAIDKSDMSWSERRQLRKEVRSIKSNLRDIGSGVYISAGSIIIVLLLLILLL